MENSALLSGIIFLVFGCTNISSPVENDGTPVGGKSVHMYYYKNSLHNHAYHLSEADDNTNVGNWIARMAPGAPTPNVATLSSMFGFMGQWTAPPYAGDHHSEISNPHLSHWTTSWAGAQNIDLVGFVPDNFDGQAFDPAEVTNMGEAYETRLLYLIDEWETNAPHAGRRYVVYSGWPQLNNGYGGSGDDPATISGTQFTNWIAYGLGTYQSWMELLVSRLQAARPSLDIRLHNINRALLLCYQNTVVGNIPLNVLFEDLAPHGRSTWYFLAAVVEYMELFDEKPPVNLSFDPSWNVAPEVTLNYQAIVDYLWTVR